MQSMLATALLAKSHTAYTYGLLCTGCFYQQLCGHIKDLKAVWCIRQGRLHSVQLFTGTFKHYGKKVPHLPLDIHLEIKLNSSAVTRLSWGPHNISQQLKVFWYWQTDMTLSSRGKKSSGKAKAVGLYVGMYFSWNPKSTPGDLQTLTLKPAQSFCSNVLPSDRCKQTPPCCSLVTISKCLFISHSMSESQPNAKQRRGIFVRCV